MYYITSIYYEKYIFFFFFLKFYLEIKGAEFNFMPSA